MLFLGDVILSKPGRRQEAGVNRSVPDGDSWVRQRPEGAQHKPQKSSQRVCNSAAGTPYVNRRAVPKKSKIDLTQSNACLISRARCQAQINALVIVLI